MSANQIKIVFGSASFVAATEAVVKAWLPAIEEVGIKNINTAQCYGLSEELLGKAGAASKFTIDTKQDGGFGQKPATKDHVIQSGEQSLQKLKTDAVDVYCLHTPDRRIPWKETLSGANELYKRGAFRRLGLSNFLPHEVEEVIALAKENNFVVPSVFEGNYSAVARRAETELFPVLRKHNLAFYAYIPIAGGFLAKLTSGGAEGRFGDKNPLAPVYNAMYNRPSFVAALDEWDQTARDEGVSRAELAYRWIVYHSKLRGDLGDAVIVGARKHEQLRETVVAMKKGPLSDDAVRRIDGVWESVKADALLDT
ncbi:aflatoxin B1 aldehyde reductase member 3 [Parathielavia appendiculata]|uniref:Aflatoxin B1 aldehyde reductase member 3 n=1 Tax=Parathielavia appendiculata TaxID=2587402 RepID=A0AAN6UDW2_9PEZI|nr:aflatoxin B1 aldehyde reductase member 3 [Parathielavia appendiculata]